MKHLIYSIVYGAGGSISLIALLGSVIKSFEPHHPTLILATFVLMGCTALGYVMSGINFRKWQQEREQERGIRKCIEGAKHGWRKS
jgi:hypothetical protein